MTASGIVVIRGGGDLGSGVAARLWRAGLNPVIFERPEPIAVRRSVSFGEAVWDGTVTVEGIEARLVENPRDALSMVERGQIPVLVDPGARSLPALNSIALVDAIMAKQNSGTVRDMAPTVVGLGPGFTAGEDVDAVVETNRGPNLGRVIWQGAAEANTGEPGPVRGFTHERIVRAPTSGTICVVAAIGDEVDAGAVVARIGDMDVTARITGIVRGMVRDGLIVDEGMKIGDIDPRRDSDLYRRISDKALAVGGGALEAILASLSGRRP